jgi:16S rRNA (uracil1498-N3)-methyltransferase
VPEITLPVAFEKVEVEGTGVMFSERDGEALESLPATSSITALVGSEGGWTDEEIESARARGFHVVTLGGRILRAETAAIAVTVLMQHRFGDLR